MISMVYALHFLTILTLLLPTIIYVFKITIKTTQDKCIKLVPPEPAGALPFVGHLHLLLRQDPLARVLGNLADDYGPAYSLRLGSHRALVVSNWQMVKECFTTNESYFVSRPSMAVSRYINYNYAAFGLSPYGPYWREIRKLVVSKLLTSQRVEMFSDIRNSEVKISINELILSSQKNGDIAHVKDIYKWFEHIAFNVITRILAGKQFSSNEYGKNAEDTHLKEDIKKIVHILGVFVASDFLPNVEWMDIGGHVKTMKQVAKKVDCTIGRWLNEHIENRKERDNGKACDFMDVMLSALPKDAERFGYGHETIIKATTLDLMWAGTGSIATTMTWALSLLLNHPQVMQAAQNELNIHVGREKWVEESDIKNLVYLQAIVKETLRMYPPGRLAGPLEAIEDCNVGGYHVTKGTRLFVNIWKLHRDPNVWSEPLKFRPERFLEEHSEINYQGRNFEYIPFSSGRRMCPAVTFALRAVHLTLARLLQGFDLSTPTGKPVDLSEGLGLSLAKVKPLEVNITPRLSHELYQIT